jgi:multimeric flavodoxin WrbA
VVALALIGSPRPNGNTAAAVHDVIETLAAEAIPTDELDLSQVRIEPIADCRACIEAGACSRDDDFDAVMKRVYAAELLVLGTPLYWYGPSAQLKLLLDRWSCLLDREEEAFRARMRGKRVAIVVAQGERGFYEVAPCLQMLDWSVQYLHMHLVSRIVVIGHAHGDYLRDEHQRNAVREIARSLPSAVPRDLLPPWFHVAFTPGDRLGGIFTP